MKKIGNHPDPIFYWTVIEMLYFTDGTIFGRVLYSGGEKDCEDFLTKHMAGNVGLSWFNLHYPRLLGEKTVRSLEYNIIATSKPPIVYKQTTSNIPSLS